MSWIEDLLGKIVMLGSTVLPDRKRLRFVQGNGVTITIADNPSTAGGLGSTDVTITGGAPAATVTVDQSPAITDSGKTYNNVGASGMVTINLPASPTVGTRFRVLVADAQYMKFKANTAQTITYDSLTSASAGYVRSNYKGASMTVEAVSNTRWMCYSDRGPWDVDA